MGLVLSKSVTLSVICCLFSFNINCVLGEWVSIAQVARTTGVRLLEDTRQLSEQQRQADSLVVVIPLRLSSQASRIEATEPLIHSVRVGNPQGRKACPVHNDFQGRESPTPTLLVAAVN